MTPPERPTGPDSPDPGWDGPDEQDEYVVDTRRRAPIRVPRGAGQGRRPAPGAPGLPTARDDAALPATRVSPSVRPGQGYGDRDYGDRDYGDRDYGNQGYGDQGYGDQGRQRVPAYPRDPVGRSGGGARPPLTDRGRPQWGPARRSSARVRRRRVVAAILVLLVAWLAFMVWVPFNAWGNVRRVDYVPAGSRPADGKGRTYLLVGSDDRTGMTPAQIQALSTGPDEGAGARTDSIMLVHVSDSGGKPVIVSIPRDSYVPIPGHGSNKINAAFAFGGAKLLTQTIEQSTGVFIDGYLEIGFGGFASIVDALGGVDVCVATNMNDPLAGINLKAGCQTLDGPNALGYVRSRHEDPLGDLGRAQRQRQFLAAIIKKAATPMNVILPWRYKAVADAMASGLIVGNGTSLSDAVQILMALRSASNGDALSLQVPVANASLQTKNAGVAVQWNSAQAKTLFDDLQNDTPLTQAPPGSTTG